MACGDLSLTGAGRITSCLKNHGFRSSFEASAGLGKHTSASRALGAPERIELSAEASHPAEIARLGAHTRGGYCHGNSATNGGIGLALTRPSATEALVRCRHKVSFDIFCERSKVTDVLAAILTVAVLLLLFGGIYMGLGNLQTAVAALATAQGQVIADVQKLLANQSAGPQPGQVIVNQSDIDALTTSVQSLTAADVAADATVNPPAPTSNAAKTA